MTVLLRSEATQRARPRRPMDRALAIAAFALCLVPGSAPAQQPQTVAMLDYHATVPIGWTSRPPASSMRLAEYLAGTAGAEVVVYFFGPSQGGTVDANLERWKSQFSNPDNSPVVEKISHDKTATATFTIAEYQGTYARGIGAGSSAAEALKGSALIAIIAETPKGNLIFQMFGPKVAVDAQRSAYLTFARSLK